MKKWLMATAVVGFTFGCVTAHKAATEYEPPPLTCEAWATSIIGSCRVIHTKLEGDPPSVGIYSICDNKSRLSVLLVHPTALSILISAKSNGFLEGMSCTEQGVLYKTFSKEDEL